LTKTKATVRSAQSKAAFKRLNYAKLFGGRVLPGHHWGILQSYPSSDSIASGDGASLLLLGQPLPHLPFRPRSLAVWASPQLAS